MIEINRSNIQGQSGYLLRSSLFNFEGVHPSLTITYTRAQISLSVTLHGGVAQLGEHLLCKQGVIGSIPFISTNYEVNRKNQDGLIAQVVRAHA